MPKKLLFLTVLFILISVSSITRSDIIPIKKPLQTKEETLKKLLIDILKPLPKPIKKTGKNTAKEKTVVKKQEKKSPILPKKKPLIAGSSITKSG